MRARIPNLLTFARVLAVPVCLVIILAHPRWGYTALLWIFVTASLTDFLDGYLARKWNAVSAVGALLDPIADKLLVALMLIYLLMIKGAALMAPVAIILLRELYISGLREFLATRNITLPVSKGGKLKTATQMAAIILLLTELSMNPPGQINFPCQLVARATELTTSCIEQPIILHLAKEAGLPLLYAAALLALVSGLHYTYETWCRLTRP